MQYSHQRYAELVKRTVEEIFRLSTQKGGEYAGDDDRLANFRRNGLALGLPMETVWAVYASKHYDAVMQYVKDLNTGKTRPRSEPISGRLDDLIVYCLLMKAMVEEREIDAKIKPPGPLPGSVTYSDTRSARAADGPILPHPKDWEAADRLVPRNSHQANRYSQQREEDDLSNEEGA